MHHWLQIDQAISGQDYLSDQAARTEVFDALRRVLDQYCLLLTPRSLPSPSTMLLTAMRSARAPSTARRSFR